MSILPVEFLYQAKMIDAGQLFSRLFSAGSLYESFLNRYSKGTAKGLDRVSGPQYAQDAQRALTIASRKCLDGTFKFTPYREVLKPKGRDKPPRIIGIPTVRDRVVLGQMHRFLAAVFPEAVPRQISGAYVRRIAEGLGQAPPDTWICGTDIKTFYDSIQRDRLSQIVQKRVNVAAANALIRCAVRTPTVPKGTPRSRRSSFSENRGIPQGLAISNILASIYMSPIDEPMKALGVTYERYVDDVLMFGTESSVTKAYRSLMARLKRRGLGLHALSSPKTKIQPLHESFEYLGYMFCMPKITVRESTVERFIQAVASKFSDFKHGSRAKLIRYNFLTEERLREIFILELNEKITGAISGKKRYGWVAYFSQINDHTLLYKMDTVISSMFRRVAEFGYVSPPSLKKISRAFWEMKYRPEGTYIRNYDKIETLAQKLEFLVERGRLNPNELLTNEQIEDRFQAYIAVILADMHADEGSMY